MITVEVPITGPVVNLPTSANDRIKNKITGKSKLTAISAPRSGTNTLKSDLGNTVAPDTVLATAHLTLSNSSGTPQIKIPMWNIMRDYNAPEMQCIDIEDVDLPQSSIKLDTGAAGYDATHVILITFAYDCSC